MSYELKIDDIYGFANYTGAEVKEKGRELFFRDCPYCKGGSSGKDHNTFSVNLDSGAYKCFRASCGKQGHFVELCRDFGYKLDFGTSTSGGGKKEYKVLPQKPIVVRDRALDFLKSRGISEATGRAYSITTQSKNQNVIVFPFYDQSHILQCVKYRNANYKAGVTTGSKEWFEKNTKPILFGMAQCEDFTRLIVTEGQLDSLSVAEAGIKNAVSVPNGAKGFTWLENCWDWINSFQEIVVFGDWENGKMSLLQELNLKLPKKKIKAVQQEYYLGEKDANDILRKYGRDAIVKAIENAKDVITNGVKRICDGKRKKLGDRERIWSGIPTFDRLIGGLYLGQLIILTGRSGQGKSTLGSMLICEALNQGLKCFCYSGELSFDQFKDWLYLQLAGRKYITERTEVNGFKFYETTEYADEKIDAFLGDNAYLYDNSYIPENEEEDGLLAKVEMMICRYGVKVIFIDNLMTAMRGVKETEKYTEQARFTERLHDIAEAHQVLIILVAHGKKTNGEAFNNDCVYGSSEIVNNCDMIMSYYKAVQKAGAEQIKHSSELIITKNRLTGYITGTDAPIKMVYSVSSKRVCELGYTEKNYKWETMSEETLNEPLEEEPPF